jgi:hypothetical protein
VTSAQLPQSERPKTGAPAVAKPVPAARFRPRLPRLRARLRPALFSAAAAGALVVFLVARPREHDAMPQPVIPPEGALDGAGEAQVAPPGAAATADAVREPLYHALDAWRDPFAAETGALLELQEQIKVKQKEIEVLRLSLEEKKLRTQIEAADAPRDSLGQVVPGALRQRGEPTPAVAVRAVIVSETQRAALLAIGARSTWVAEGEFFGPYRVAHVDRAAAVLVRDGRQQVLPVSQ